MQTVLEYTQAALQPGTCIGPYRLIKQLDQGGMSIVYLGYHVYTRAFVAIKVVDSYSPNLKMFYREIDIMQTLEHEHIVPCLDAGTYGTYHYLVMPYLPMGCATRETQGKKREKSVMRAIHDGLSFSHLRTHLIPIRTR